MRPHFPPLTKMSRVLQPTVFFITYNKFCFSTRYCFSTCVVLRNNLIKNRKAKPQSNIGGHDVEIERIRNIGIMAHIDAGKTTTTERILYFAGLTKHLGNVDDGDTVMDYMEQERNRGITITSAAITFFWNKHRINLIDTPGHVDFTLEVERSLRVLDGAVAVLDAAAGVEAQTLTVWRQANKYNLPRIIYLNKMDKTGACVKKCVSSVIEKLHPHPLVIQFPIGNEKSFQGFVDLVSCRKYVWAVSDSDGSFNICEIEQDTKLYEQVNAERCKLIEQLADIDDCIANHIINDTDYDQIPAIDLMNAIRKATLLQTGVPVLCGSSVKNKGVQPLMNAIISFLPNPLERTNDFVKYYKNNLCALAFKTIHDKHKGPLTFMRIYSGNIKSGSTVFNVNRDVKEKVGHLLEIYADDKKELSIVSPSNIAAVAGFTETVTGDTIVSSKEAVREAQHAYSLENEIPGEEEVPILAGLEVPEPVFMCSVEAPSLSFEKQLNVGLSCLSREDPSLRIKTDKDTGQTILSGMGELHLDIIKDRLLKEFGVEAYLGPLFISYRETIVEAVEETNEFDKIIGNAHHQTNMCLSIHPKVGCDKVKVDIVPHYDSNLHCKPIRRDVLQAINSGVKSALSRGPILGSPVIDVKVELHDFAKSNTTSLPIVSTCAAICVTKALKKAGAVLLQPMMTLQIQTDEDYASAVMADLAKRNSNIINVDAHYKTRTITATTPLSEMVGYSTSLRTLSSGCATFTMELAHYESMGEHEQAKAIKQVTGFLPV